MNKSEMNANGKPQLEYLFGLVSGFCEIVFTSCKKEKPVEARFNPIFDKLEGDSPLNGMLSAMDRFQDKSILVVAVDMPAVSPSLIESLLRNRDSSVLATCFRHPGHAKPEPLLAIYEPSARTLLEQAWQSGHRGPSKVLHSGKVKILDWPAANEFLNLNTPEELQAFRLRNPNNTSQ